MVAYFFLLFLMTFGISFVNMYHTSLSRRCVWADGYDSSMTHLEQAPVSVYSEEFWSLTNCSAVGRGECTLSQGVPLRYEVPLQFCKDRVDSIFLSNCGVGRGCVADANPFEGLVSFDNLPTAMLSLFQVISYESSGDVLLMLLMSEPDIQPLTVVLFIFIAFFCSQLLLNMFVAVVTETFAMVRNRYGSAFGVSVWQTQIFHLIDWAHERDVSVGEIFDQFDSNGDGRLTVDELVNAIAALNIKHMTSRDKIEKMVLALIKDSDVDNDGSLSLEELKEVLQDLDNNRRLEALGADEDDDSSSDSDDENGDGQGGQEQLGGLVPMGMIKVAVRAKQRARRAAAKMTDVVARVDADSDELMPLENFVRTQSCKSREQEGLNAARVKVVHQLPIQLRPRRSELMPPIDLEVTAPLPLSLYPSPSIPLPLSLSLTPSSSIHLSLSHASSSRSVPSPPPPPSSSCPLSGLLSPEGNRSGPYFA
jgi:hypothetical protein